MCQAHLSDMASYDSTLWFGIKVFVLIWMVAVPIIITARLEKIIKLLDKEKK